MIEKIIPGDSQEELIKAAGCMVQVYESGRHIKSAASRMFTRADLEAFAPPPGKFLSHTITLGSSEMYGANRNCLFADEPVRTPFGFVKIQDLRKGDLVLTEDGTFQAVTKTYHRDYRGVAVKFCAQGLALPVVCTSEHPIYRLPAAEVRNEILYRRTGSRNARKRPGTVEADKNFGQQAAAHASYAEASSLRPGDWVAVPVAEQGESVNIFDADPWVYGLFLADACVYKEYREINSKGQIKGAVFTLGSGDDAEVIPRLLSCIEEAGNKASVLESYTSEKGRRVNWCNKGFALSADRLFGAGAIAKTLRAAVFGMPASWKLGMLAGWFDGDGCLQITGDKKYRGTLIVSTASLDLASSGQRLLASLGIPSCVSAAVNKASNGCFGTGDIPIYQLAVSPAHSNKLLAFCHRLKPHNYTEERKRVVTQRIHAGKLWFKITNVELFDKEEPCYNLEVAGSHTYVTTILGHNCDDWPHEQLLRKHATFVTHGRNYREHRNQKPEYAIGEIKAAKYDPDLQRGECLMWTDIDKAAAEFEKARKGEEQHTSMAASIDHDVCECCDHISKVASDRCDCIRFTPGAYSKKHKKYAHMINFDPTFKDNSWVGRPADRIAHTLNYLMPLSKAASVSRALRGDELAELYGMVRPAWYSRLQQISEFDKPYNEHPGKRAAMSTVLPRAFEGEFDNQLLEKMSAHAYPGRVMRSLINRHMVMPLASFNAYVSGVSLSASQADPTVKEARQKLAFVRSALIDELENNPDSCQILCEAANQFEPMSDDCGDLVDLFMDKARDQFSLRYEALAKRAKENAPRIITPSNTAISPEAFGLGALYNLYLAKTASMLPDDWMTDAQLAYIR